MSLTYGEMFAGYGGLGLGVQSVLGGEMKWCAEFEAAPSKILAHHWPNVPNLGDVTKIDWHAVEPVDVITGGSPCQDLSHAGKRAGMKAGTRSGLWASMCDAIDIIRPRLVVWENVRGALSAEADSAMEQCPRCVGDPRDRGPVLRALGRVLGDLAELGYDAWWYGLRAADVGGAHGRFRVFLFATPADAVGGGWAGRASDAVGRPIERAAVAGGREVPSDLTLLPTPAVNDMGKAYTPQEWDAWTERMRAAHGNGNGHGKSLEIEAQRLLPTPVADHSRGLPSASTDYASLPNVAVSLLPTPRATDGTKGGPSQRGSSGDLMLPSAVGKLLPTPTAQPEAMGNPEARAARVERAREKHGRPFGESLSSALGQDWREYEAAIRRQERAFGRPAPAPTEPGKNGKPRLSPLFVEWLMGLPEGHVTGVPGVSRNDQLKALGNGVCPQQAAAATRAFLNDQRTGRSAA